ncbi:MAG: transposase [Saprospiraceae bacterium]|nr:transposase [Saprospiraceae bacterium]
MEKVNFLYWFDAKKFEKPLFLISTLDNAPDIQYAYAIRFRIETMFKDLKSRGFSIDENRLGKEFSLTNLLIVVALAFCIMLNFGFNNQHNPLKIKVQRIDKKINSIFTFARLFFQYCKDENIDIKLISNINFVQNNQKIQT